MSAGGSKRLESCSAFVTARASSRWPTARCGSPARPSPNDRADPSGRCRRRCRTGRTRPSPAPRPRSLTFDDVDDLVVRGGMELHQDLAHHTHTRLQPLAGQRQRIEVFYDAAHRLLELAALQATAQLRLARRHPVVEQAVRAAFLDLVRTRAVQRHHQQVAVEDGVRGLQQHGRRHLEAGVALAQVLERQRDHRNMRQPHRSQRLADKRDVIRGAAAAACLRDDDRQLVGIVAAGHDGSMI